MANSFPYQPALSDNIIVQGVDGRQGVIPVNYFLQSATYTNPTLAGNVTYMPVALGTTGTVTWNLSLASTFTLTPTGSAITLNATNLFVGQDITLIILTSGTTSCTITFGSNIRPASSTLVTGTVSGKYFIWQGTCDGTQLVETLRTAAT